MLAAIGGLLFVGVTNAADLGLANAYLLPSVAAAVIGGTSIFGGVGGYSGTILGALILTVLDSLLTLLDTAEAFRQILYGLIILGAGLAVRADVREGLAVAIVRTVAGDVDPAQLGPCDAHEHLFLTTPIQPGEDFLDVDKAIEEAGTLAAAGGARAGRLDADRARPRPARAARGLARDRAARRRRDRRAPRRALPRRRPAARGRRGDAGAALRRRGARRHGRHGDPRRADQGRRELSPRHAVRGDRARGGGRRARAHGRADRRAHPARHARPRARRAARRPRRRRRAR